MNKSTDEEIMAILSKNEPLTVHELSTSLNLTKADIRYHIKRLLKNGRINEIYPLSGKRGRPAFRYQIDNSYFAHNLHTLVDALIKILSLNDNDLSNMANYISSKIQTGNHQSIITKFNDLVIGLNKQNYQARWESQYQGPVIFFSNCPYRLIVQDHPILCELDKKIIKEYLDRNVTISQTIHLNGTPICKFQVTM